MPLIVKDFSWEETEKSLFITVPLKGVKASKVDLLSSEEYLKVSYPPFLFECLLAAPVDDTAGTVQIGDGCVVFKLHKKEEKIWGKLQAPEADDKEVLKLKREEAIAKTQARTQDAIRLKGETKRENEKLAVREMMKIEETERCRIEGRKQAEREKATADLEAWKKEQQHLAEQEKERILAEKMEQEKAKRREEKRHKKARGNIFIEAASETGDTPRRQSGKIEVNFTERVFPTPIRESTVQAEEEWLKKQAEARQVAQLEDNDLSEEERNPQFLRDKGNCFFATGNYQAAVNAYTHAIRLNPKMPSLYSNRAACHLKLRNFFKCIEDCSKALDLFHPPVPQNAASRCKAHVRRGTAFCELEMYVEGLVEYEAALKIEPDNPQLKADADKIRQVIQGAAER